MNFTRGNLRRLAACALAATLLLSIGMAPVPQNDDGKSALESNPDGWTDLLESAGEDMEGWTRLTIPPGGKVVPESQWSLDPESGVLVCSGEGPHEWMRWDKPYGDAIFHVEWRFIPAEGRGNGYNSGVYARNSDDARIWHQAQTGRDAAFLFGETERDGKLKSFNLAGQVEEKRVKPPGEWNVFEITCRGKTMSLWVNGAEICALDDCEVTEGHVGLEAEGWRIEFRNVKVKPL